MSKFLNKKEQVFDLKLTNYGHHLISVGSFKPTYYAFLDDNVVYDSAHFGRTAEVQSDIHQRIKQETPYLESLVLFEEVGKNNMPDSEVNFFQSDITPTKRNPRIDEFRFNSLLGDSFVSEDKQKLPSWKVASLQSDISSSTFVDTINNTRIPQINITANYSKRVMDKQDFANLTFNTSDERALEAVSRPFADDKVVYLEMNDVMVYLEEVNTEVLNENFDIEVFLVQDGDSTSGQRLTRKYFQNKQEQIVDDMMVAPNPIENQIQDLTPDSAEQYFSVFLDSEIDRETACKLASSFNKESYYIDLDFDCNIAIKEDLFYDIYGSETEAEICQT